MLSDIDGPFYTYGNTAGFTAAVGGYALPDPNSDAGPNVSYQGNGLLDVRYIFAKDRLNGASIQPVHYLMPRLSSARQIPAAVSTSNIAAAANVVSGTAMTLVAANATGITINVPIIPYSAGGINNNTPVNALALDFGFAFCTCTAANTTVVVSDSLLFQVGMPVVIAGAGNAGGTIPLLTFVASITDSTHIVLQNAPLASPNPAAIGTGNLWSPNASSYGQGTLLPTAAIPYMAGGPGLFLDPRQTIARVVSITGASGGSGGTFTVRGYDIYNAPLTDVITVGAGAVTGWGHKAFKYIVSVTPGFTDAHNYSVGTSDMFGLNYRAGVWDDLTVTWANGTMVANTGFTAGLALTTTVTTSTSDVRGLIQTSTANGSGTGIGTTASNGTVSSLAMSGNRLTITQDIATAPSLYANPASFATLYGSTQV